MLLLTWGVIDQTRYYLALHSDNLRDLRRAEVLDSFDSPTQMRLAHREHPQLAETSWRKAMLSNPSDPAPRQALLRFLIEQKRFDDAYGLTETSLTYAPRDASLWMDRGLLAQRRGDSRAAIDSWRRALAIDPGEMRAHLYIANELDHKGEPQLAAAHYKMFLSALAQQPAAKRPEPEKVIAIVLRMADCQSRASQMDEAFQSYQLAAKMAAQTRQAKLESIATINQAAIQQKTGNVDQVLRLYQHALQLDESIADRTSSAEDWLAYGRFLQSSGFPSRLAYACFVKSSNLQDSLPDASQRQYLGELRKQSEKELGVSAAAIRRNLEPLLREALALRR